VVALEGALVPQDVVASAEQDQVVDRRGAAVGAVVQVVGVAHRRWAGAAPGGAAEVTGGQGAALGGVTLSRSGWTPWTCPAG
jgi:hypothetical protein